MLNICYYVTIIVINYSGRHFAISFYLQLFIPTVHRDPFEVRLRSHSPSVRVSLLLLLLSLFPNSIFLLSFSFNTLSFVVIEVFPQTL